MTSKDTATATHTNSLSTRFARRFLISFLKMKRTNDRLASPTTSHEEIRKRSHRIKIAAHASIARAVGSRRAWSRALLFKLRNRAKFRVILRKRCLVSKKKKKKKKKSLKSNNKDNSKVSRERGRGHDSLRKLVPGGETMDVCSLLEETAHYIKCLATQVKVMQSIADHYSK